MTPSPRLRRIGPPSLRQVDLGARIARLPSEMERGNAERARLYASPRWRRERRAFLRLHPICITAGCGLRAVVVDHRDGHQRPDWLARFWDQTTWQPMCTTCHGIKSRAELTAWRQAGEAGIDSMASSWAVVVECEGEAQQCELIARLESEGLKCKGASG